MGCPCKNKKPEPTPPPIIESPEQLHAQEITEWNGGEEIKEDKTEEDGR